MNKAKANELSTKLKGYFPKISHEQMLAAAKKFDTFDYDPCYAAVEKLAEEKEDYSFPRLMMLIREQLAGTDLEKIELDLLETIRKDAMKMFPGKAAKIVEMKAAELIIRVGRGWWLAASDFGKFMPSLTRCAAIKKNIIQLLDRYNEDPLVDGKEDDWAMTCCADQSYFDLAVQELSGETIPSF